jgi:D-beta-D-heptose 7-phosphate kinase/D-beta-D-heptose 1-phosphate adenosyltransferase
MKNDLKARLLELVNKFSGVRVLVIGDLMVDEHIFGEVNRISPEAPVPVVLVKKVNRVPGGAGNVANNLNQLGVNTYICGVIGKNDEYGKFLIKYFKKNGINSDGLFFSDKKGTIVKTRIIAHQQQLCRVDREDSLPIDEKMVKEIIKYVKRIIKEIDAILLSDYRKGVLIPALITEIIKIANDNSKIISVDPKVEHFMYYKNVDLITPNHYEASDGIKMKINNQEDVYKVGKVIMKKLNLKSLIITQSKDGMTVFEKNKKPRHIPTNALQVYDVTGAGDTVISVATASLAAKANILESAILANYAAGIVVGKVGTAPVTKNELLTVLEKL